ncbi:hypothetical protein GLYMA_11G173446v4 [Glycine max]|nr:hypothetical protein GLYMA_11G173446v4 [Glycine max]KAH1115810.1 hypothetical protein GYH30_057102 [Glycine max]
MVFLLFFFLMLVLKDTSLWAINDEISSDSVYTIQLTRIIFFLLCFDVNNLTRHISEWCFMCITVKHNILI